MTFEFGGRTVLLNRDELDHVASMIKEKGFKIIMEIGFYDGGSALYWNSLVDGGWIMSMEKMKPPVTLYEAVKNTCEAKGNGFSLFLFDSTSPLAVSAVRSVLIPRKIQDNSLLPDFGKSVSFGTDLQLDMLFIDGDHTGSTPLDDFVNYSPFVREGGMVVFDDLNSKDVRSAFSKASLGRKTEEFISPNPSVAGWNGLGVIHL
jgi:cephalosporin hydroxylase